MRKWREKDRAMASSSQMLHYENLKKEINKNTVDENNPKVFIF